LSVPNTDFRYNKTINFTVQLYGERGGATGNDIFLSEFRQINNTAGYEYVDNYTITVPISQFTGYDTVDVFVRGEEQLEPDYTQQRMYRVTLSQF
jgi:hypothetical protein